MRRINFIAGVSLLITAAAFGGTARADEVVVYHTWSKPSEIAALGVLRDAWAKDGHQWKDLSIAHDSGTNVSLMNMIAGGNPPAIFMNSDPGIYRDLNKQNLGVPLNKLFDSIGATKNFPPSVLKNITVDGQIMKAPATVHIDGMIYYNKHVADAVGIDPKSWTSLDDLFAAFDKVKAAGYIPIAQGGDQFQKAYLLQALIAAEEGLDIYNRFYGEKPDKSVLDTSEMRAALKRFRQIADHTDPGSPNRQWNDTTNLVITGKALLQIHGDWMKGEFLAANKKLGTDFDCMNIPGTKAVVVTVDAWGFLNTNNAETAKAQEDFAKLDVDPKLNAEFVLKKGASPVRTDADTTNLDACNKLVLDTLKDPNKQVSNPFNTADADWYRTIWEQADKYWSDPKRTDEEFIHALQDAYDQIF
ncbi:ABC transporter substrate-binding protein [Rhizobium mayense]|uniref:ABC transporter substrate-binding protein n=1 Tax=Rhizobium mayense TaxID=1312184 RepID=UPI00398C2A2E